MSMITVKDGTLIYFKDWGAGPPVVFSHGWPLNADSWEAQMLSLTHNGYRCIAHDRRGHGRSGQPWNGNEMDTYADDLAELIEKLDLQGAVLIGFSAGGKGDIEDLCRRAPRPGRHAQGTTQCRPVGFSQNVRILVKTIAADKLNRSHLKYLIGGNMKNMDRKEKTAPHVLPARPYADNALEPVIFNEINTVMKIVNWSVK